MQHSVRRVVTGHDAAGKAVVRSDARHDMEDINHGEAWFLKLWTSAMPADNNDGADGALVASGLTMEGGTVLRIDAPVPPKANQPVKVAAATPAPVAAPAKTEKKLSRLEKLRLEQAEKEKAAGGKQ